MYDCSTTPGAIYLSFRSFNVIYLIACCRYSLKYNGAIVQKLNRRFNLHETGF